MNTNLPAGLCVRPVIMADLEPMTELFNDFTQSQFGMRMTTPEDVRSEWQSPVLNLETDTLGVFTDTGRPVGYIEFWDVIDPHVAFQIWGAIHPDFFGRGIGSYLVDWGVERAKRNIALAPPGARVVLDAYLEANNHPAHTLFTRCGFQNIRSSYWMRIDFDEPPQPPAEIPGITIRSIVGSVEQRAALKSAYESFKDHWGHIDEPFEAFYERRMYMINNSSDYDPHLWFIALDGDEIAGVSLCRSTFEGSPDMGWINTLGVERPWRKRGIGLALLQHSFYELHKLGRTSAGLGVDASSLTGATRLYEKAGMRIMQQQTLLQMELRPGEDLRTSTVS